MKMTHAIEKYWGQTDTNISFTVQAFVGVDTLHTRQYVPYIGMKDEVQEEKN